MAEAIRIENVTKRFGEFVAVDDVDLTIEQGEFFSLLGPSGCGKTTTLRMLAGFEVPSEGRILLEGEPVEDVPPYKRDVNMVFQSYALFDHLDVAAERSTRQRSSAGSARRSSWSTSPSGRAPDRSSSRAASASGCHSRGRWSTNRKCCSSTSRSARSTSSSASRCRSS